MGDLFKVLRDHGWRDEGTTLYAPGRTMWLETTASSKTAEMFLADMRSRRERLLRIADMMPPDEFELALADVESAISAAESVA